MSVLNPESDRIVLADTFPTKSIKMARWEILDQYDGITDSMKVNILSTISTSIDTHGTSDMYAIAKAVKDWLDETHGPYWTVVDGEDGKYRSAFTSSNSQYLRVKETRLGWRIVIYKQTTP
ncbi:unnamed protein product [Didymodactylos carnosus]|uniref:Uncharacterized protein n=1 Tax=Didymodactylos carnosus TaxID=1234261 RepID=A0A815I9H2_9BILA|nr:unnamed protein product [Didymodactylos carnosus]CAF1364946.1 unnamed protein product [Didymodactylos carnosus]CAF3633559.1 unnamed protein product [Didymodactylos carnosus]CAF4246597.1 unnamed protein product [Didymodactylos carnosus]